MTKELQPLTSPDLLRNARRQGFLWIASDPRVCGHS